MKKYALGCGVVLVVVLLILGLGGCNSYNRVVGLSREVNKQWAQVENVYQRRADLIPNLVSTVSGAANFEKSTLVEITEARASVGQVKISPGQAPTDEAELQKYQEAQGRLSSALSRLLVVAERYPELKANSNFLALQSQLEGSENRITVERQKFNDAAQNYNTAIQQIPTLFIARLAGYTPKPYFTSKPGSDVPPKVEFNFGSPGAK